jgi:hypothetical protein
MPFVVTALAEPPNVKRLVVVVVMSLNRPAPVHEWLWRRPAVLAGFSRNDGPTRDCLLKHVLRSVVLHFTTTVEVVVVAKPKLWP